MNEAEPKLNMFPERGKCSATEAERSGDWCYIKNGDDILSEASAGSAATAGLQIHARHAYRYKIPAFIPPYSHCVNKGLRRPFTVARLQISQAHDATQIGGFLVHNVLYTLSICTR